MFAHSTVHLEVAAPKRDCGKQKNEVLGGSSANRKLVLAAVLPRQ
jgi:hypothetical protein